MSNFSWGKPEQNWFRVPHSFLDVMFKLNETECKLIIYIMRHTWGYGDDEKSITMDEFISGRKRKDGTRIDGGTGMSKRSIINGLKRAEENGYINVEIDDSDKGRVKKYYSLASGKNRGAKSTPPLADGVQILHPPVQNLHPPSAKSTPRTEKETLERNLKRETTGGSGSSSSSLPQKNGTVPQPVIDNDYAMAAKVYEKEIGVFSPVASQILGDLVDEYTGSWVVDALKIAVERNKRNLSYTKGILKRWKAEGRGDQNRQSADPLITIKPGLYGGYTDEVLWDD